MQVKALSPKVTWLLPVRNGMPFLPETLASLAAQTYRNFQVLAWDDGSTDGSIEELKRWIPNRLPGQVFSGQSLGVGGALRELVERADTEFCARIDADDVCQQDRLEKQITFLQLHSEIALVGSHLRLIDEKSQTTGEMWRYPELHDDIVHTLLTTNSIGHPSVMFRRSAVLAVGNYDSKTVLEDYDLWLRLAQKYKMANLPEFLVDYRVHPQSVMRGVEKAKMTETLLAASFSKQAPTLFGITSAEATRLQAKRDLFVFLRAMKIVRHLSLTQEGSIWKRLRNPSLIQNLRSLTRARDLFSRFALAFLDQKSGSVWCEFIRLLKQITLAIPQGRKLVEMLYVWNWRRNQKSLGGVISERISFSGRHCGCKIVKADGELTIETETTIWVSDDRQAQPALEFGERVYVCRNTYLGVFYPITIGSNTMIGAYSYIISGNHRFDSRDIPIRDQGYVGAPIHIGEDVWVGTHVVILPGVTIGKGAIVAAGSIVNRSIPEYEIWGGVPARFIKSRP